jgi:hypothetical protein
MLDVLAAYPRVLHRESGRIISETYTHRHSPVESVFRCCSNAMHKHIQPSDGTTLIAVFCNVAY